MPVGSSRFLEPRTLSGIQDLELVARTVVEGFLSGLHLDPRPGTGAEFSQHRSYQPGDDLRRLDWRVFARSDRYYVRESDVERDVTVRFVFDASASMGHAEKFDYARFLAASLAYLVDRQGDRIAFNAITDGHPRELVDRNRQRRLTRLLHMLEELEPGGRWPAWDALGSSLARRRPRELVVVVSDMHQSTDEIDRALSALRTLGHEVLVLHLLARDELAFDHTGDVEFEDLETGRRIKANAEQMRPIYLKRLQDDLAALRRRLLDIGVAYEMLPTDQPLDRALRSFLVRRRQLVG